MWFDMRHETLDAIAAAPGRVVNDVSIDAPPSMVFEQLADPARWPTWYAEVRSAAWDTAAPYGVGSDRTVVLTDLCVRERIVAFAPAERFAFTITAATLPLATWILEDFQLEALDGGQRTRLVWTFAYALRWYVRPLGPFLRWKFGGQMRRAAAELGRVAAAGADAPGADAPGADAHAAPAQLRAATP